MSRSPTGWPIQTTAASESELFYHHLTSKLGTLSKPLNRQGEIKMAGPSRQNLPISDFSGKEKKSIGGPINNTLTDFPRVALMKYSALSTAGLAGYITGTQAYTLQSDNLTDDVDKSV